MSRREDIWSQLAGINTQGQNLFDNYNDLFDYNAMSDVLSKILGKQVNLMGKSASNAVQRGQKDSAERLAASGITDGSVYENQMNKVADSANENYANALEQLGVENEKLNLNAMDVANQNKFRTTSANQNVIMQNIMNALQKNRTQLGAVDSWEQSDRANDAAGFDFFRDLLPGLVQGGSNVASAAIKASDVRTKKNISYVGISSEGIPIVDFNYKNDSRTRYRGVLAQDVEKIIPEAVVEINGIKMVDYSLLSVKMEVLNG